MPRSSLNHQQIIALRNKFDNLTKIFRQDIKWTKKLKSVWLLVLQLFEKKHLGIFLSYYFYLVISSNRFGISSWINSNFHQQFNFFVFTSSRHFPHLTRKQKQTWNYEDIFFIKTSSKLYTSCCHSGTPFSGNPHLK